MALLHAGAGYTWYTFLALSTGKELEYSSLIIWLTYLSEGFFLGAFNLAHYLIAVKYQWIATNVPKLLNGDDVTNPTKCTKIVHWLVSAGNVTISMAYGVLAAAYYN